MSGKIYCYCVYSNTSRNSTQGLQPQVMLSDRASLIEAAEAELQRCGQTLEDLAGVAWRGDEVGNSKPERELGADEKFRLAIRKLDDDGRLFEAFDDTEEGRRQFIEAAKFYGRESDARELVARFSS